MCVCVTFFCFLFPMGHNSSRAAKKKNPVQGRPSIGSALKGGGLGESDERIEDRSILVERERTTRQKSFLPCPTVFQEEEEEENNRLTQVDCKSDSLHTHREREN